MLHEKRYDDVGQVTSITNTVRHPIPMVDTNHTAPKKSFERVQDLDIALMLNDREFRKHLKSHRHLRVSGNSYVEAPYTVDKSGDPFC
jgi:hypothetical protein